MPAYHEIRDHKDSGSDTERMSRMFKPRMTKPENGNRYYNTIANGGVSTAIIGRPRDSGCNVLANCVGYVTGRFNEIIGSGNFVYFNYPPNAEDLYEAARSQGLAVGNVPRLGAMIVWAKGKTTVSADGAGHAAIVEQIHADGSIITSESGYDAAVPFWLSKRSNQDGNWGQNNAYRYLGFVYQPEIVPEGLIRKGDFGDAVWWMQEQLAAQGYLRRNEIDGYFGIITLGGLLAFQFEKKLIVDGICGAATKAALLR